MVKKCLKLLKKQDKVINFLNIFFDAVAPKAVLILLLSIFLFSCGERAPVNEEYLDSEDYKQFKKNQQKEYAIRIKTHQSFKNFLTGFVECSGGRELSFPIQFGGEILEMDQGSCDTVRNKFNRNFTISYIGYSEWKDIIIRWILLQKESVYDNAELLAVTYHDNSLIGFQTVGVFRENLQQNFSTEIEVSQHDDHLNIKSVMDRGLKYPFEYDNVIQSTFQIDTTGKIIERTEETSSYQSLRNFFEELSSCSTGKRFMPPLQINEVILNSEAIPCKNVSNKYNIDFTARSIGYTLFKDIIVRLIDMRSNIYSDNHLMMAGAYKGGELVSFQRVGKFHSYSLPNFVTDIDISSNIKIRQKGDSLYIISSIIRDRSFPIKQADSMVVKYVMGTDGNIIGF